MDGYRARHGVATGVHDDLFSRAIAFEGPDTSAILVSVDVLALSSLFTATVRRKIAAATTVPDSNIVIAATHTHSGPHTIRTFFNADVKLDEPYMERLQAVIAQSGVDAWFNRVPALVGADSCEVAGVGANRRAAGKVKIDREAAIVRVDRPDGTLMAVLMVYGCHPTVLGVENLSISADFPAAAIEGVERSALPAPFAMFLNGAEGNVSIGHSPEMSAIGRQTRGRTFEHAWELGGRLAGAVLKKLPAIETSASTAVRAAHVDMAFPGRPFAPLEGLKNYATAARVREMAARSDTSGRANAAALLEAVYADARYNNAQELAARNNVVEESITGIRIGSMVLLAVPAEVFSEIGLAIKASVYRHAFVISLANGYWGYLPAEAAYSHGGYEVEVSMFARESEKRLIDVARKATALLL